MSKIRHFYFGDDPIDEKVFSNYVALFSDINFARGVDRAAKFHDSKSFGDTYYYR